MGSEEEEEEEEDQEQEDWLKKHANGLNFVIVIGGNCDGATMALGTPPLMCHTRHISGGAQNPCMKKRKKRGRGRGRGRMQMLMAQEACEACEAYEIGPARKLLKRFQPGSLSVQ